MKGICSQKFTKLTSLFFKNRLDSKFSHMHYFFFVSVTPSIKGVDTNCSEFSSNKNLSSGNKEKETHSNEWNRDTFCHEWLS